MSFTEWLKVARPSDDATGDLIKDLRRDALPPIMSKAHLYRYLINHNACREALREVGWVWGRYKNWTYKR